MRVDVRPISRMRGKAPVDVAAALGPVLDRLTADSIDLSQVRIVCDWLQYKHNFRNVIDARPICGGAIGNDLAVCDPASSAEPCEPRVRAVELAIDLRRAADANLHTLTDETLTYLRSAKETRSHGLPLEEWSPGSGSRIWDFNAMYWAALDQWENATGRAYEQALPGGQSDARNLDGVREILAHLFGVWDDLASRRALPDELFVVELGVGNGNQAMAWLDEFCRMDLDRGSGYYRRLHYLMCDYSPHVLKVAAEAVRRHREHVSSFVLDATQPLTALAFLQHRVFLVYISNVYDNLPTDEVASLGGRTYLVQSRAYLPDLAVERLTNDLGTDRVGVAAAVAKLLALGPELAAEAMPNLLPDAAGAVAFWRDVWTELRLDERYVPIHGLDRYEIAAGINGEMLRPFLDSGEDIRLHVSNGAAASFTQSLRLLHPYGRLISHDLFVQGLEDYRTGFRGPGKYEGSVVCWINGPLLAHLGRRAGYDVTFSPFNHHAGTNIVTLTAEARD